MSFRYSARGARMYETKTDTSALAWSPTGWAGVSMQMLQQVESTGGVIGVVRLGRGGGGGEGEGIGGVGPGTPPRARRLSRVRDRRRPRRRRRTERRGTRFLP